MRAAAPRFTELTVPAGGGEVSGTVHSVISSMMRSYPGTRKRGRLTLAGMVVEELVFSSESKG